MSVISNNILAGAAGAAGTEALYVDDVFSTYLYTGNNSTQTITNGIDLNGEGGMVWVKTRNSGYSTSFMDHAIVDTVRGDRILSSNSTADDTTWGTPSGFFPSFNSDGFTVGSGSALANHSSRNYASWTFRKAPGFFDVVTYTGNGTAGREIPHSLGSTPGMVIVKRLNGADNWTVQHRSLGGTKSLYLNLTNGEDTSNTEWNNTAATSTVFTVGTSGKTNANGDTYVAYLFAHDDQSFGENGDEAIIKCGSYNGGTAGQEISVGFEPQWLLVKRSNGIRSWITVDSMRPVCQTLSPNSSIAEVNDDGNWEPTANGFRLPVIQNDFNGTGMDYVYVAIRRPHKPPEAATDVFAVDVDSASSTIPTWDSGFPVDMAFALDTLGGAGAQKNSARLLGSKYLVTSATSTEASDGSLVWDSNEGWGKDYDVNRAYYSHMFRRAPGFFDVVTYSSVTTTTFADITHNLGVQPELMIIKDRNQGTSWHVWSTALSKLGYLNLTNAFAADNQTQYSSVFYNTDPTATTFRVGTSAASNNQGGTAGTYVAYLFATHPGVSKIGTYQGNDASATIDIDCGFTNGARFVLIKDTTYTGNWYIWDSVRGIVSGNDPILKLDSTDAQLTSSDWIDPLSSGFQVSTAGTTVNSLNHTYLFLAIA